MPQDIAIGVLVHDIIIHPIILATNGIDGYCQQMFFLI